jgi:5-methylcytosine-specific restriction protein A
MPIIPKDSPKLPWIAKATKPSSQKSWGYDTDFYRRKKWRNLRAYHLQSQPLCVECEKKGRLITATVVDHIKSRRTNRHLELDENNLQSLCESCHNSKSGRSGKGRGGKKT